MLKLLRKKMRVILIGTLAIIIPAFVLLYGFQKSSSPSRRLLATVNGESITLEEYSFALENLKDRYSNLMSLEEVDIKKLEKLALDSLVEQHLLLQEAEKRNVTVKDEEILRSIKADPLFRDEEGNFDRKKFEHIASNISSRTWQALEDNMRIRMRIDKLKRMITHHATVNEKEVSDYYKENFAEAKVKYLFINPENFKEEVRLSEEEVKNFYEVHRKQFKEGPKIRIEYILSRFSDIDDSLIDISPEETEDYYKENREEWAESDTQVRPFSEVKEIIEMILKEKKKEDLAEDRAFQLSLKLLDKNDWGSFAREEHLSYQKTGFFSAEEEIDGIGSSPELKEQAFSPSLEEVSEPLRVDSGYIVFQVVDRKEPVIPPLEEIKEKVKDSLREEKTKKIAQEKGQEIVSQLQQGMSMENLGKENSLPVDESVYFPRGGFIEGIGFFPEIVQVAFSLERGEYSKDIPTSKGVYIIQLIDKKDPSEEQLPKYQSWIRSILLGEKRAKIYEKWLKEVKERAKIKPIEEPATEYY